MNVITEYMIVKCSCVSGLEQKVDRHLIYGWQPVGGAIIACDKNADYFLQTMVKYRTTNAVGKTK